MSSIPYIDKSIILYLEATYPLSTYNKMKTHEEVVKYQGTQDIISHLRSLHEHFDKHGNLLNVQNS